MSDASEALLQNQDEAGRDIRENPGYLPSPIAWRKNSCAARTGFPAALRLKKQADTVHGSWQALPA
jgi:hypothetical protein